MSAIKLYRHPVSGHSHRVEVFLSILRLNAVIEDVQLSKGEHKSPDFLKKNIFGQLPVLEDGDFVLADSNAILVYLASRYDPDRTWLPENPEAAAEVQRFLSVAAGKIASGPAIARIINVFNTKADPTTPIAIAHSVFEVLNAHLADRQWLATDKPTIADLANYTYIAHAPEGNISLDAYPHIQAWLKRVEDLEGFHPLRPSKVGLNA